MNKAIVEAGCAINSPFNAMSMSVSLADGENAGMRLGTLLNAPTIADLRNKTWQEIVRGSNTPGSVFATNFTVDDWSLEDSLYNTFKAGRQNDIPFMIGAGEGEPLKTLGIQLWADALLTGKSNMYVYLFSHVPTGWRNQGLKAYHGLEVAYQFGGIDTIWFHYRNLFAPPAGLTPDPGIDEQDVWLTEAVMSMWAQFAETGDPSIKGLIKWPHFELKAGKDRYLDIDVPLEVKSGYMDLFH
jgi:para-nitrobenzyl esterase